MGGGGGGGGGERRGRGRGVCVGGEEWGVSNVVIGEGLSLLVYCFIPTF